MTYILAIDQGTSSTKTILFDEAGQPFAKGSEPLKTIYPENGFVEQDPQEIVQNVFTSIAKCLDDFQSKGGELNNIKACGICNQRETFVVWDENGTPLYNAVVWQCKRSIAICVRWKEEGYEEMIKSNTGLLIDPYFSGTKLLWLYENNENVRTAIDAGRAYFGTVDTWLLYKLTNGESYCTDYTNASRTLFFNLKNLDWDKNLLQIFGLSNINLPQPQPSSAFFGSSDFDGLLPLAIGITGMIGDSHAAAFGEGCFYPGMAKATLGTGCSIMMNIGDHLQESKNGMVATVCWSTESKVQYAFEGVIVSCGATIEWLKNELGFFTESKETETMASEVPDNGGVYIVPAFSGLGAPHWQMNRKASISGLTFSSTKNHIVRAALESIPYQIMDVIDAMEQDTGFALKELMVNGGMVSNGFVLQLLASLLNRPIVNNGMSDASAQGAAYLAGLKSGIYKDLAFLQDIKIENQKINPEKKREQILRNYGEWKEIIKNTLYK